MEHVKGPDFPGGGLIMRGRGDQEAYATGRGCVRLRAKAHVEPLKGGKDAIIVTELPFMVKKGGDGGLITKIADLVREKKIDRDLRPARRVRPLRDAARDRAEARRGSGEGRAEPALQAHPDADELRGQHGRPRRQRPAHARAARSSIPHYVGHQREVVTRRTQHELRQAEARAHILEGLLIALDNLDAVIKLIRGSADPRRGARGPDREVRAVREAGAGDPRHAAAAPDRAASRTRSATSTPSWSSGSPSCARSSATRRGSTALITDELPRSRSATATSGAPRSPSPRATSTSRT